QLATWVGPADWQLLVVSREPGRWVWAGWLPPAARPDGSLGIVLPDDVDGAAGSLADDRTTVVVTDEPSLFDARTGPLRRLVAATDAITLVAVEREHTVPSICARVLQLGSTGWAAWFEGAGEQRDGAVLLAGVDENVALRAARTLASLVDPEDSAGDAASIPTELRLAELDAPLPPPVDPSHDPWAAGGDAASCDPVERILRRWRAAGSDPAPCTPVGMSADGVVDIDLVRDGPHGLIAGTTGSGKSELLRTLVVGLSTRCSPDHLTFVLVDYKGGSTFDACARLPHTVGLVTDLDEGGAARALRSLEAELRRREHLLRDVGAADLTDYRRGAGVAPLPRLAVVVDEFAALARELPDFLPSLVGIAQRGRSLGVHLLLATQRPAGVVNDDIRANTNLRLALRLNDVADARDVVGDDLPATLSRSLAGRAVLRLGPDELVVFQAAHCTVPIGRTAPRLAVTARADSAGRPPAPATDRTELAVLVDAAREATARAAIEPPHRPWFPPLPTRLEPAEVDRIADRDHAGYPHDGVGLVDDPERQAQRILRWDPADGNLALVGALGAGTTSTLVALAAAWCRTMPPDRLHLYVIDAAGDRLLDGLESIAHVGAVVRARDHERLHRLLVRLDEELDARLGGAGTETSIVVLVDGYDSLRAGLMSIDDADTLVLLDRLPADGLPVALSFVAAGPEVGRVPTADRWAFAEAGPDGADRVPGRLRIESSGLEAQVALGAPGLAALPDRSTGDGPPGVDVLADRIDREGVGRSWSSGTGERRTAHLVVGRCSAGLADAVLAVPAGDHVFVGGSSRSGKSTALASLVAAWCDAHPGGRVVEVDRRRALDLDALAGPTVVVVDDADRVDDAAVASLAADRRPSVTLMVAARMEAVRSMYGHWTREVARSRCGLVLTSAGEVDGDLLGATLPRRTLIPPRPGLAWMIDAGGHRLIQVAVPT
ncbi:MAG: FtsK/SpoIIIE domain-containing protein, partial [Ilumatobacteraceae bacterium]